MGTELGMSTPDETPAGGWHFGWHFGTEMASTPADFAV